MKKETGKILSQLFLIIALIAVMGFMINHFFFQNRELLEMGYTRQDIQKFNSQYPNLTLNYTSKMHDRFLIIDNTLLYHIGASLKDLGKKCFAFELLDSRLISSVLQNV